MKKKDNGGECNGLDTNAWTALSWLGQAGVLLLILYFILKVGIVNYPKPLRPRIKATTESGLTFPAKIILIEDISNRPDGLNSIPVAINPISATPQVSADDHGTETAWIIIGGAGYFCVLTFIYALLETRRKHTFSDHKQGKSDYQKTE